MYSSVPRREESDNLPFSEWFAASSVSVRRNGRPSPMMVYHMTNRAFDRFSIDKRELGFHFGTLEQASSMARYRGETEGLNIRPVYLSIQRPIRLRDEGSFHADGIVIQLAKKGLMSMSDAKAVRQEIELDWRARRTHDAALRKLLQEQGYDGVVYKNNEEGEGNSWIAFEPWQIRSAFDVHAEWKAARLKAAAALRSPEDQRAVRGAAAVDYLREALKPRLAATRAEA